MAITWTQTVENVDWDELSRLYERAPLGKKNPETLQTAFQNSRYALFAWDSGKLIGAGRVLSDGVDCAYICDVALLPEYQGAGLGKTLVQQLLDLLKNHQKIILYAAPGKEPFYRKLGFSKMNTAMAVFSDAESAWKKGIIEP
jgi:ribosomal protein S18 acetylase RimI-like enzyme